MKKLMLALTVAVFATLIGSAIAEEDVAAPAAMTTVESSAIKEIGYNAETLVLTVTFVEDGGTYEYQKVPKEVYEGLMAAESKGTYFDENIKGKFEFTKK